jgi:ArsR family transcriptional regulator
MDYQILVLDLDGTLTNSKKEITQPTLSHHMKILVECGLVNDRKEGKWHHYSLNCDTLLEFKNFIGSLTCESCCDKKDSCC